MRFRSLTVVILGIGLVITAVVMSASWWPAQSREDATAADVWTCSMHPQIRVPRPGACPICGMALIPASQLQNEEQATAWSAIATAEVTHRELSKDIQTVGKLDYNEARWPSQVSAEWRYSSSHSYLPHAFIAWSRSGN